MTTSKNWSYEQITEHTESRIKAFMAYAVAAAPTQDDFEVWMNRNRAWGAYYSWYELTCGWQNAGDNERLENLTKIENYQPSKS